MDACMGFEQKHCSNAADPSLSAILKTIGKHVQSETRASLIASSF